MREHFMEGLLIPSGEKREELATMFRDSVCPFNREVESTPIRNVRVTFKLFLADNRNGILKFGDESYPLFYDDLGCCAVNLRIGIDSLHLIENVGKALLQEVMATCVHSAVEDHLKACSPITVSWASGSATLSNTYWRTSGI